MKFSTAALLSALALTAMAAPVANPVDDAALDVESPELVARANLPGLTATQTKNARAIIAQTKKEKLGQRGCVTAITTGLVESNILIYANKKVPKSLDYPHDAVGSDHDSIGIFQQRASIYTNIKASMGAGSSAGQFFDEMRRIDGWKTMAIGKLCQAVQRSAYPDRYAERVDDAEKICKAGM